MKKCGVIPKAAAILSAGLCAAAVAFLPAPIAAGVCTVLIAGCAYLALYYSRLKYHITDGVLYIGSGLIFRRTHILPMQRVLWRTRVTLPLKSGAILTVLHTAGAAAVIFGDLPDNSL